MGSTFVILTFDKMDQASQVLESMHKLEKEHLVNLKDSAVITKDENGTINAHEDKTFSKSRGAATGGALGFMLGAALGGPIGGVLLGGAAGAWASKKVDLGISNQRLKEVAEEMPNNSSALCLQIKKVEHKDLLLAFIKQSGGKVAEIEFSDGEEANMFELTSEYRSRRVI